MEEQDLYDQEESPLPARASRDEGVSGRAGEGGEGRRAASRGGLTPKEREVLTALCDAIVPSVELEDDPFGFYRLKASDMGVDVEIERLFKASLSPEQQEGFRRLLRTMDGRATNLLLTGLPSRFTGMSPSERQRYLLGWSRSGLSKKRQAFQVMKRLVVLLFYSMAPSDGINPAWRAIGYDGPPAGLRGGFGHPEALRIVPVVPEGELTLEGDVCVVGSGAGGGVIAAKLAQAGHRVVVLEAGPYRTADNFTGLEGESYRSMFQGHAMMTTSDLAVGIFAGQTAGGSTTVNWMTCIRPPAWVREEWERVHGMEGLTSPAFDSAVEEVWTRLNATQAESQVNPSNEALRRGCEALGYSPGSDYDVIYRNAQGCEARCDYCFFGCVYNAKQSTLVTYLPDAFRAGAKFLFQTKADRVVVEGGEARGVEATYRSGDSEIPVHIRAPVVVVAGSALQTPALLWRSGLRSASIGRGLRIHPNTGIVGEYPHPIRMWKGPMQTIVVRKFQDAVEGHHGPVVEAVPAHPGLAAVATPWLGGAAHKDAMRRFPYLAPSVIFVRDVAEGRVTTDSRGEPVIHYRLSQQDRNHLLFGMRETARIHWAAGAHRIWSLHSDVCTAGGGTAPVSEAELDDFIGRITQRGIKENAIALFTAHPTGSARAGLDPRTSTANPNGECHDVRNLWIGDGSLLPSAPGVNPMISIMALAVRTAGFIIGRLRGTP
jgi:choline dehydrogenase-like flavoprotein